MREFNIFNFNRRSKPSHLAELRNYKIFLQEKLKKIYTFFSFFPERSTLKEDKKLELVFMLEMRDFSEAIANQKEIIIKLQEILKEKIEIYSSEELDELSSAIQYAAEALNNLAEYNDNSAE